MAYTVAELSLQQAPRFGMQEQFTLLRLGREMYCWEHDMTVDLIARTMGAESTL
jgi:hypothetical protein